MSSTSDPWNLGFRVPLPVRGDLGIGIIGAGFIVCDCHLPAYRDAGLRVVGLTSRTTAVAREVAGLRGVPKVARSVEALLDDPAVELVDVAVPPREQGGIIDRILAHPRRVRGILAQKPLAMSLVEARRIVSTCAAAGIVLQVNQNMRYDPSVRALRTLIDRGILGESVLATIDMRAVPHWMSWAEGLGSLTTFLMSIHHIDTFRFWLGEPKYVMASTRPDPRTKFAHDDGINLYIFEYENGARASSWDDVWNGPSCEGAASELAVRWRFDGTSGTALGTVGWPAWPRREPSTIAYSSGADLGAWHRPHWPDTWFPDAFAGPMIGLINAVETGATPDIGGLDNLRTIALCEAVRTAAREHRVVDFPREYPAEAFEATPAT